MRITTTRTFDKKFKKQPPKIRKEFEKRIDIFLTDGNDPALHVHKLKGEYEGMWSLNVTGDIRVVFDKSNEPVILFLAIGSHSELYS